jgi:transcriptional regulator with XRE-family HTH domain
MLTTAPPRQRHPRRHMPKHDKPRHQAFRATLIALLKRNDFTQTQFGELVGRTQSGVAQVVAGALLPPVGNELNHWAAVLRLLDRERDEFLKQAYLCHVPDYIAEHWSKNEKMIREMRAELDALKDRVSRMESEPPGAG